MTVLNAAALARIAAKGTKDYFRHLERLLEQMQRQIGKDPERVEDANIPEIATAQTTADTAQTAADSAALSSVDATVNPLTIVTNSDTVGVFPASDPAEDIVFTFKDNAGTEVANRTMRGTLTSASGIYNVTEVSNNNLVTGYSTAYTIIDQGTSSAAVVVTLTDPNSNKHTASTSWNAIDESTAGTTPVTGAGK